MVHFFSARRRENWPEQLMAAIARHAGLPFAWGVSDCFRLPMDCVLAMTGAEPWPDVAYRSERAAARALLIHGHADVAAAFAAAFGEIPVAAAGRGDLGVIFGETGPTGVVFVNDGVAGKTTEGLLRVPRGRVGRAFRVG